MAEKDQTGGLMPSAPPLFHEEPDLLLLAQPGAAVLGPAKEPGPALLPTAGGLRAGLRQSYLSTQ